MVFIGPRGVVKTPTRGLFYCPNCDGSRAFVYRRVRRFFVLFYVPVLPLKGETEFVQCGFCRKAYRPSILERAMAGTAAKEAATSESDAGVGGAARTPPTLADPDLNGAAASTLLVWEEDEE